jgi:hypothetical protein
MFFLLGKHSSQMKLMKHYTFPMCISGFHSFVKYLIPHIDISNIIPLTWLTNVYVKSYVCFLSEYNPFPIANALEKTIGRYFLTLGILK